ncbi:hypothetical protein JCM10213_005453 [Rhodosporidiobolus nylandii]
MSSATASPASAATGASPAPADVLDTAKLLVQKIARTFYGSRGAILVDQLVRKECYRDEEIGKRLGMQPKDIAKIAHRLVEDGIVQVHRRSELRDNGMQKAQQRTYYYFDYSKAVDAIKWRMWRVQQTVDVKLRNELDAQGYVCPLCKASYTPLDAASLFDPMRNLLACSVCATEVVNNENEEDVKGNKDRMQRLNRQTKGLVELLKGLERGEVPRFDVEPWLAIHGPALGATAQAAAEAAGTAPAPQQKVTVTLAGDDDEAREQQHAEEERRRKREQNALPNWIAQSTISADPEVAARANAAAAAEAEVFSASALPGVGATMRLGDAATDGEQKPQLEEPAEAQPDAGLDAYYASLAAAASAPATAAAAAAVVEDFGASTFDFGAGSLGGTASAEGTPVVDSPYLGFSAGGEDAQSQKRSREESFASSFGGDGAGEAKRQRLSPSVSLPPAFEPFPAVMETPAAAAEDDDYDEDDFEEAGGEGGDADPNQLISVNGVMKPFSEVTEDMTGEMTADEYSAYWEVYQRVNG